MPKVKALCKTGFIHALGALRHLVVNIPCQGGSFITWIELYLLNSTYSCITELHRSAYCSKVKIFQEWRNSNDPEITDYVAYSNFKLLATVIQVSVHILKDCYVNETFEFVNMFISN